MAARDTVLSTRACRVEGCGRGAFCKGLCRGHYARSRRGADLATPIHDSSRGNVILACRVSRAVMAQLAERAAVAGVTVNKQAAQLLAAHLGLAE